MRLLGCEWGGVGAARVMTLSSHGEEKVKIKELMRRKKKAKQLHTTLREEDLMPERNSGGRRHERKQWSKLDPLQSCLCLIRGSSWCGASFYGQDFYFFFFMSRAAPQQNTGLHYMLYSMWTHTAASDWGTSSRSPGSASLELVALRKKRERAAKHCLHVHWASTPRSTLRGDASF